MLVIKVSKKNVVLARVPYINYLLRFKKNNKNKMRALIDSASKVNVIIPAYALKLGIEVCQINVEM